MAGALVSILRRALASVLVLAAVLSAIWVADLKVWYPRFFASGGPGLNSGPVPHSACLNTGLACTSVTPGWALPVGLVIGLIGVLAAAFLYRPRAVRPSPAH